jgi:nucleoid DNA-binding protein
MNNYLLLLLKELKTIIIPGLGALTITNEATNELLFMPFLKYDDGTLSKYIAEKEGMEVNDAKNLIAKFVREVLAELDKGEQYDMYQFGSFSRVNNEIVFKQWETKAPVLQEEKDVVEETNETTDASPEVIPEQEKTETNEDRSLPTSTVTSLPEIDRANEVEFEIEMEEVVIPSVGERVSEPEKAEEKSEEKIIPVEKVVEPIEEEPAKEPIQQTPITKKKSNWVSQLIIGLIVLVLSAGTYIAVNFNTLKKDIPFIATLAGTADTTRGIKTLESKDNITNNQPALVEKIPEELALPAEKTTKQEDVSHKETQKKAAPKKAPKTVVQATMVQPKAVKPIKATPSTPTNKQFPSFNNLPFQLIAGSFSSQQAAAKHTTQLARKGITTCAISQFDGKYRVSIGSAKTKEDALNQLVTLKSFVTDAWVFEVK